MTLEHVLGIEPDSGRGDNNPYGIEISARRWTTGGEQTTRRTLFAKTPEWGSGGRVSFLDQYGSLDERGRWSLYTSVYAHRESSSGWRLRFDTTSRRLMLLRHGEVAAYWEEHTLADRLAKHRDTMFVYAKTRFRDREEFWYFKALHAMNPDLGRFLAVMEKGGVCHDLTLHRNASGGVRDHGFLFRIGERFLPDLFETVTEYDLGESLP